MRNRLLHILLLLTANLLFAQQPVTIQLTEKDGLPDIEFYDLIEDRNGFIWLAADKGLYRYDGKSFVNYTHPEKRGLSVFGLFEDSIGRIWCNNISGQFFYVDNAKLTLFTDLKEELKGQLPEFIIQKQHLIAFSEKGVFKINLSTKKRTLTRDKISKSPYYGYPFQYREDLYFSLSNNIKKFNGNNSIENVLTFNDQEIESKNNAFCNLETALFFSSFFDGKQHFYLKENNLASFKNLSVPKQLIDKIIVRIVIEDSLMWFCTDQGVIVCSWNGSEIEYKNTYLATEYITKTVKDKNNNFWFSSLRNGVFVMPNIYVKKIQLPETIRQVTTMAIVDEHHIAYGTPDGKIGIVNPDTFQNRVFPILSKTKVSQIVYNEKYKAFFISQESGSYLWSLNDRRIYKSPHFTASKAMMIGENNSMLNASYDRASIMENPFTELSRPSHKTLFAIPVLSDKIPAPKVINLRIKRAYTCFYSSRNNISYVGFVDELIQFEKTKQTIIRHKGQPIFAIDLEETEDGTLWISTFKNGLLGVKNKKVVYNFTSENGLLSNQTGKLKSDGNLLWITTEQGVQILDTQTKVFKNITKNDGLESYAISDIEIVKNQIYLSSNKGIFIMDKVKSFKASVTPKIYFTHVSIQEKDTTLQSAYQLAFDKNALKIGFHANGFQTSESIAYQYRLLGLNNKWLSLEKGIEFVSYSSLPPGNFTFEVKAINQSGSSSKPIQMQITIETPFWQKWWFYVLVSLTFVSLVWFYFRTRLQRAEKEKQILLEKAETDKELIFSQLENLRSQMNPHFIFNALNSIQEYIVTNEKQTASAFLVKFSRLIRIYLEHSRESEVLLDEELKALGLYLELERDRFEDTLHYTINVTDEVAKKNISIPSLFIQPYIENALKHGLLHKKDNRELFVSFTLNDEKDSLICTILDNGIGRAASAELNQKRAHLHKSFATTANQKRIELINKTRVRKTSVTIEDLYDGNHIPKGTKVNITIPF